MTAIRIIQAFKANARLGWDMEGNWVPPLVYLIIALAAPVAGVLMLVFMYMVVLGDSTDLRFLSFFLTGAAVFMYVRLILQGAGFAVVEDREHYRVLRYIYIAPVPFPVQIFGRIMVKLLIGTVGVVVTLIAGRFLLNVPFRPDGIRWAAFFIGLTGGLIGTIAIGWILSSVMLLVDRMGWVWAEGLNGLLFLFSGAVIPLKLLPGVFSWIGILLPISYWAELWRWALFGTNTIMALEIPIDTVGVRLWVTSMLWLIAAFFIHRLCDRLARKWARIERETFY